MNESVTQSDSTPNHESPHQNPAVSAALALSTARTLPDKSTPILDPVLGEIQRLSSAEEAELRACEEIIRGGWNTFIEVGRALARIREAQLYRTVYVTFDAYCLLRWNFCRSKVYSLISAAQVIASLAPLTDVPKPDHESQLRPLFGLAPSQTQLAWQYAAANSFGRPITAKLVKKAIKELQLKPETEAVARPIRRNKTEQRRVIRDAIGELLQLLRKKTDHLLLIQKVEALENLLHVCFVR